MCKLLKISRQTYYNHINGSLAKDEVSQENEMIKDLILHYSQESRNSYGTRSLKAKIKKHGFIVSRRKIAYFMDILGLASSYQKKKNKNYLTGVNNDEIPNLLEQNFNCYSMNQVLTSDLTYVSVNGNHNYVCFIIDLFNRQILGHSIGIRKDADLVLKAFENTNVPLEFVEIFHTDRGLEFKNNKIDGLLKRYDIKRSLSSKGNPYDNAVSESTFKTFKTAWVRSKKYSSYMELLVDVNKFVEWFNNDRPHSALNYHSPLEFKQMWLQA